MNVTVFGPYSAWPPHFETELEIMERHLESGDSVTFITCDAVLSFCEVNPQHNLLKCLHCIGKRQKGLSLLRGKVKVVKLSHLIDKIKDDLSQLQPIPSRFESYDSLYSYEIENYEVGAAVLSSLNSHLADPRPDPSLHVEVTRKALQSSIATFKAIQYYLDNSPCDIFYLFNGRLSTLRASLRACQSKNVKCYVHERGPDLKSYWLADDTLPHDPAFQKRDIEMVLKRPVSFETKQTIAKTFYEDRTRGVINNWYSFIDKQEKGTLPDQWLNAQCRIAVFTSTEGEFSSLQAYYPNQLYPSQKDALFRIVEDLSRKSFNGRLAIRMHPNSHNTKSDFTEDLNRLNAPFLDVIAPEDKIDSYALLMSSEKVLTFGSTMGIEAAYWGKPSIIARASSYEDFGSNYKPRSHDELISLLLQPLKPMSREGAVNYAYYSTTYGEPFRFVVPNGVHTCTFNGKEVRPNKFYRLLNKSLFRIPRLLAFLSQIENNRLKRIHVIPIAKA